jgi:hypothetical protein
MAAILAAGQTQQLLKIKIPAVVLADAPRFLLLSLYPGDIGASTGLVIDEHARVLGPDDKPIGGLYACGNDMQSIMGGTYPGPGITIGPGITFAYIAARHARERIVGETSSPTRELAGEIGQ